MICIECEDLEEKIKIMKRKNVLKGSDIKVEEDHTKREIEVQKWMEKKGRLSGGQIIGINKNLVNGWDLS